jgi:hypothetical protein
MGPQGGYDPVKLADNRNANFKFAPMLALDQEPLAVLGQTQVHCSARTAAAEAGDGESAQAERLPYHPFEFPPAHGPRMMNSLAVCHRIDPKIALQLSIF